MKTIRSRFASRAATLLSLLFVATGAFAGPTVSLQLEPSDLALGESARLTVSVSGGTGDSVAPPEVPGLEFSAVGQSSQYQSVNGVATSTASVIYQVTARRAGTFTIPSLGGGSKPLTLTVHPGQGPGGAAIDDGSGVSSLPPPATGGLTAGATHLTGDGSAFARLLLPKRELYVGETVPVDIQVGLRPGLVASLNGLPTLNGDSFTLNKLSSRPDQTEATIGGKPYTLITWHSVLAAVKPGDFSVTVETPLTVQMRTAARRPRMPRGIFDDAFSDAFFQDFFGGTTEKEITVSSDPDTLKILALPMEGRPVGFSGAVGEFAVGAELSSDKSAAGDPLTLRLKVSGEGNFDRVKSSMLGATDGWKTYPPTDKFEAADSGGYSGTKTFEQAVIPLQSGRQQLPELAFSYFDPEKRQFVRKTTQPLTVDVAPAPGGGLAATVAPTSPSSPKAASSAEGLRPDKVESGGMVATLQPLCFRPWFVGAQSVLALGFIGGWIGLRRREHRANDTERTRSFAASGAVERCLAAMDSAAAANDSHRFFQAARSALQERLAARWHVAPASITIAEIDARLNGDGEEIRRVFAVADEAAYSGQRLATGDFQRWKEAVRGQLEHMEAL
jgi:hypothetical protein